MELEQKIFKAVFQKEVQANKALNKVGNEKD